MLENRKTESCV